MSAIPSTIEIDLDTHDGAEVLEFKLDGQGRLRATVLEADDPGARWIGEYGYTNAHALELLGEELKDRLRQPVFRPLMTTLAISSYGHAWREGRSGEVKTQPYGGKFAIPVRLYSLNDLNSVLSHVEQLLKSCPA